MTLSFGKEKVESLEKLREVCKSDKAPEYLRELFEKYRAEQLNSFLRDNGAEETADKIHALNSESPDFPGQFREALGLDNSLEEVEEAWRPKTDNDDIGLDPNDAGRNNADSNKDDYDQVIEDCTEKIKTNPNYVVAYHNRGLAYANRGDYDRAIEDFTKVINLTPYDAVAYRNRGDAHHLKGDCYRAIADYNKALRCDPNDASVWNARGKAYLGKGDYVHANEDFTQAIKLDPDCADA